MFVFECNVYVGIFEEAGEFSNFWTVICEGCLFFVFVFVLCLVDVLLFHFYFNICYEMLWEFVVLFHGFYCIPYSNPYIRRQC